MANNNNGNIVNVMPPGKKRRKRSLKSNSNSLISRNSTLLLTFHLVVLLQDTFCAEIMQISATMGPKNRIKSRLSSLALFEV